MNFNPGGGTNVELPITTDGANAVVTFQFDQPYQTQEPAGSTATVTSNVYIYLLDSSGNVVVGPTTQNNNVAMQAPIQQFVIPNAGSYFVAIQVISGPNPGHVEFINDNENVNLVVNQQYGSAGGTYYPTSFGHHTDPSAVDVGATPWWAPTPYLGQNPLANEPFSSDGPAIYVFSPNGQALSSPTTVLAPTITAPDGGNTSFFPPDGVIDTSNPPFQGEPATSTNLSQDLPSFFGTSSATPNAAAVAALMLQLVPSATPAQIRASMITAADAHPMNGATPGTWNAQGGYGLINAIDALNAVDLLRVSSTNPANGATVTSAPSVIQVDFNKPVVFSTLSAADLTFTSAPAGVTVNVGAPIAVDNATDPTIVDFPISFTKAPGVLANGGYSFSIQSPASGPGVVSQDGKDLVASSPVSFTLADVTAPGDHQYGGQRPDRDHHLQQGARPEHGHARQHHGAQLQRRVGGLATQPVGPLEFLQSQQRPARQHQLQPADLHSHARLQQPAADRDAVGQLCDRRAVQHHGDDGRHRPRGQRARRLLHRVVPDHGVPGPAVRLRRGPGLRGAPGPVDHDVHDEPDVRHRHPRAIRTPTSASRSSSARSTCRSRARPPATRSSSSSAASTAG